MTFHSITTRHLFTFILALLALVACQNATSSDADSNAPLVATASFTMANLSRVPDSAAWRSHDDSGFQKPACDSLSCVETFHLAHPLGADSLALELWTLGIRTSTVYLGEKARSADLDFKTKPMYDPLDTTLLARFHLLQLSRSDSLKKAGTLSSDLVYYLASLVVHRDSITRVFTAPLLPTGMNPDSLKKALVYWAAKSGETWTNLATAGWGLDTTVIRSDLASLIRAGLLASSDTLGLLHPVRATASLSVAGPLTAGGIAIPVSGSFSWNKTRQISPPSVSVRTGTGADSNIAISIQHNPSGGDTSWNLTGNLMLQANRNAAVGTDTLVIVLATDSGFSVTSKLLFRVLATVPTTPKLVRLSPANQAGNLLPFEKDSLAVSWRVVNWSDVNPDSVSINGIKVAKLTDSTWGQNVFVDPTGTASTFAFRVLGKNDTAATDLIQVTRAKDTVGPGIQWITPSSSISVDATVASYQVQLKATDPSGVDSVYIQGSFAHNDSGSYWSATVPLPSPNGVPVKMVATAWDKVKNATVDSTTISITRNVPGGTDVPTLTLVQPASRTGNTLPLSNDTLHIVYRIADLVPLDTTKILFGGILAKRQLDSTWAADVPVPPSGQPVLIVVQATNTKGNGATDQIAVTRARDSIPPTIVRSTGTHSQSVLYAVASLPLSWTIKDNYKMGAITLNGSVLKLDTVVLDTVQLKVGVDSFFLVATDSNQNASRDTVVVTRQADPSRDTTLRYLTVSGIPVAIAGTTLIADSLPGLTKHVSVAGLPSDSSAKVTFNGDTSGLVTLVDGSATVAIKVSNGSSSLTYYLTLVSKFSDTIVDSRDGQIYKVVKIGSQWWMGQNLNYSGIVAATGVCYGNSPDSCSKYGRLYQWAEAMGLDASYKNKTLGDNSPRQGLCPTTWHVPSDSEWTILTDSVGTSSAGTKLKSSGGWATSNGTNAKNFNALPGGYIYTDGTFHNSGSDGDWWSATDTQSYYAWNRGINDLNPGVTSSIINKAYGFSLRCVMDR
jgi:uncharacterized protein (TIGR02145 family)